MSEPLCPHCLQPLRGRYEGNCPHCGRLLENRNPEGALPLGTQLAGRYTIGTYLSADGDGLAYRGILNEEKKFVLIKEYFPVTLCNGRSPEGALMPKEGKEVLFKTSRMDFKDLYDDLHNLTPATGLNTILDVMEENNTVYAVMENPGGIPLQQWLDERPSPVSAETARNMLQPVFDGVAAMHQVGLVHRGICPENIRVMENDRCRLAVHGHAAPADEKGGEGEVSRRRRQSLHRADAGAELEHARAQRAGKVQLQPEPRRERAHQRGRQAKYIGIEKGQEVHDQAGNYRAARVAQAVANFLAD